MSKSRNTLQEKPQFNDEDTDGLEFDLDDTDTVIVLDADGNIKSILTPAEVDIPDTVYEILSVCGVYDQDEINGILGLATLH